MQDYLKLRKDNRRASAVFGAVSILTVIPDEILDLLNIPSTLRSQINDLRSEDDTDGMAAAMFAFFMSNSDMTEQDRLVVGQILTVAGGDILNKHVVTKYRLDSEDVLTNVDNFKAIALMFTESSQTERIIGDSMYEELERLANYIEQYDRGVKDKSKAWFKGKLGDVELPVEEAWYSWIPFLGK